MTGRILLARALDSRPWQAVRLPVAFLVQFSGSTPIGRVTISEPRTARQTRNRIGQGYAALMSAESVAAVPSDPEGEAVA